MKKRISAAVIAACVMGTSLPMTAYSASPSFARTDEEWAKLQDNTIEYSELEDLVHEYNVTVQNNQYDYQDFVKEYGKTKTDISDKYRELAQELYDDMSGESDASSMISDLTLQVQADNMEKQADDNVEDSTTYRLTYEKAEKSIVVTAQSNMISYYKNLASLEQLKADQKLLESQYQLAIAKQNAGVTTELDTLSAQEKIQTIAKQIQDMEDTIENTRQKLCLSLGWKHDDQPVIEDIPKVTDEEIAALNPQTDLSQAVESNYTLRINKQKLSNATDETNRKTLNNTISQNEKQIGSSLNSAYKNVLAAKSSYDQAVSEAELAQKNTALAAVKKSSGVMTALEYEEQQYEQLSKETAVKTAEMTLLETVETYRWSVRGLASAE